MDTIKGEKLNIRFANCTSIEFSSKCISLLSQQGPQQGVIEGDFSICISLYHGYELLQQMGLRSLFLFIQNIFSGPRGAHTLTLVSAGRWCSSALHVTGVCCFLRVRSREERAPEESGLHGSLQGNGEHVHHSQPRFQRYTFCHRLLSQTRMTFTLQWKQMFSRMFLLLFNTQAAMFPSIYFNTLDGNKELCINS